MGLPTFELDELVSPENGSSKNSEIAAVLEFAKIGRLPKDWQRRFINHFKTLMRRLNYNVVLSMIQRSCSDVLITTLFYLRCNDLFPAS